MLDVDDLREAVRATSRMMASVGGRTFPALFRHSYTTVSLGDAEVESRFPYLVATEADIGAPSKGAHVTLCDGQIFNIRRIEPDGSGMVRVILEAT